MAETGGLRSQDSRSRLPLGPVAACRLGLLCGSPLGAESAQDEPETALAGDDKHGGDPRGRAVEKREATEGGELAWEGLWSNLPFWKPG